MKPVIFLSHSPRDSGAILRLKDSLLSATHGTLDFFLSSDGTSITPGRNWVEVIFAALSNASLMFVFLSPVSLQSQWIFFEAGLAYSRGIQVVPVGISGVKVGELTPPLGLLQGINLDSPAGLDRIVEILNTTFAHAHRMQSSADAFNQFQEKAVTPLKDGAYDFQVFARSGEHETVHELLRIELDRSRMTVRTRRWESVGILVESRFVGRFKHLHGSSPDDVGTHDFIWNGREFVGSAKLDSGRWLAENLVWRQLPAAAR